MYVDGVSGEEVCSLFWAEMACLKLQIRVCEEIGKQNDDRAVV